MVYVVSDNQADDSDDCGNARNPADL